MVVESFWEVFVATWELFIQSIWLLINLGQLSEHIGITMAWHVHWMLSQLLHQLDQALVAILIIMSENLGVLLLELFGKAQSHVQSLRQLTMPLQIKMDWIAVGSVSTWCREVLSFNVESVINELIEKNVIIQGDLGHQLFHIDILLLPVLKFHHAEILSIQFIEFERCLVRLELSLGAVSWCDNEDDWLRWQSSHFFEEG